MSDREKYHRWNPQVELPSQPFVLASLSNTGGDTEITLRSTGSSSTVALTATAIAFRRVESNLLRRLGRFSEPGLYEVANSGWLDELREEARGLLDWYELTHFAVHTTAECIDLACMREPAVAIS